MDNEIKIQFPSLSSSSVKRGYGNHVFYFITGTVSSGRHLLSPCKFFFSYSKLTPCPEMLYCVVIHLAFIFTSNCPVSQEYSGVQSVMMWSLISNRFY